MGDRKLAWSAIGGMLAGAAGIAVINVGVVLTVICGLAPYIAAFTFRAYYLLNHRVEFARIPKTRGKGLMADSRSVRVALVGIAATVNAVIAVMFGLTWQTSPVTASLWFVALGVVVWAEYAGAVGYENHQEHKKLLAEYEQKQREKEQEQEQRTGQQGPPQDEGAQQCADLMLGDEGMTGWETQPADLLRSALSRLEGRDELIVSQWVEGVADANGNPFGARFNVQTPARLIGSADMKASDAERIAGAINEVRFEGANYWNHPPPKLRIKPDWVGITKQEDAGSYDVVVVNDDIMGRIFPWSDELDAGGKPRSRSIKEPALVGYRLDARPYHQKLLQHGMDTGQSRSGKSTLVQAKFAHTTACEDEVDWICAAEKVNNLVGPWLIPYEEHDDLVVPFDWIAVGYEASARMISTAMSVARWRQAQPLNKRGGFKKIIVWLEEAGVLFKKPKLARAFYDGEEMDVSELVGDGTMSTGSAGVVFRLILQRSTNVEMGGHRAGSIRAQMMDKSCFMTGDSGDVYRATGSFQHAIPKHPGQFWLNPGNGELPLQLKAPYIQTDDTGEDVLLPNGPFLSEVSWSRRHFDNTLDPETAAAIPKMQYGQDWVNRKRTARELIPYVQGTTPEQQQEQAQTSRGESIGERAEREEHEKLVAMAPPELRGIIEGSEQSPEQTTPELEGPQPSTMPPAAPPAPNPPSGGMSVREAIRQHLVQCGQEQTRQQVAAGAAEIRGKPVSPQQATNHLPELLNAGTVIKRGEGAEVRYLAAELATASE